MVLPTPWRLGCGQRVHVRAQRSAGRPQWAGAQTRFYLYLQAPASSKSACLTD